MSGAGTFTGSGTTYTLDFGDIADGSGSKSTSLSLLNMLASGGSSAFTDLLGGAFTISGNSAFTLGGFDTVSGLAGDAALGGLTIAIDPVTSGIHTATITLAATSSNASSITSLGYIDLVLTYDAIATDSGSNVPEPGTLPLMLGGLGLAWYARRQAKRAA